MPRGDGFGHNIHLRGFEVPTRCFFQRIAESAWFAKEPHIPSPVLLWVGAVGGGVAVAGGGCAPLKSPPAASMQAQTGKHN